MEKSGCAMVVAVILGLVFVASLWLGSSGRGASSENVLAETSFAKIGDTELTLAQLDRLEKLSTDRRLEQARMQDPDFTFGPREQSGILASALFDLVNYGIQIDLAKKQGVDLSDASVRKIVGDDTVANMESQERAQLEATGKLKAGATQSEFEAALKAADKPAPDQVRADQVRQIDQLLADPATVILARGYAASTALRNSIRARIRPTDDQLKRFGSTLVTQRVLLRSNPSDKEKVKAKAESILEEIKGGLDFKRAMAQHSQDNPNPGKSLAESISRLPMQFMGMMPGMDQLEGLNAGQMSGVIETFEGFAIYRVQAIEPPTDFAKLKTMLQSSYVDAQTTKQFDEMVKKERAAAVQKITVPGFRALLDIQLAILESGKNADWQKLFDQATEAMTGGDAIGMRAAAFARMETHSRLWASLTADQKAERRQERVEVLTEALQGSESVDFRLELVDLLLEMKSPEAGIELFAAASANNQPSARGQQYFGDINARLLKLREAQLINDDAAKQIEAEQRRWVDEKRLFDEEMARQKREEEEARKRAEAEAKAEEAKARPTPQARDEASKGDAESTPQAPSSSDLTGQGKR